MKTTESTIVQLKRFFKKVSQKFPSTEEPVIMTDIHLSVSQDTGELLAFDDNDNEITRCVVDQWINCKEQDFYINIAGDTSKEFKENINMFIDKIKALM